MSIDVNTKSSANRAFTNSSWFPPAAVVAAAMLFGSTGTTRRLGPDQATTLGVGAVRLVVGAAVLLAGVAAARRSWHALRPRPVVVGAVAVAAYQITFFTGTERTGVTLGTITALATGPAAAGLLELVLTRRRPSSSWLIATSLAIIGVVLAVAASGGVRFDALGTAAAVAAGASYAVYATTVSRLIAGGSDPLAAMAATFAAGAVLIAPLLFTEPLDWMTSQAGAVMTLHLGVATVAIAYALYAVGLARLSVPTAVTLTLAEPVTATLLGRFVLDERVAGLAWMGVALVVLGLLLVGRSTASH